MSNIDKAKQAVEAAQKQLEDAMKAHYVIVTGKQIGRAHV